MRKIIFASLLLLLLAMACVSASDADDIAIQTSDNASDVIASDEVNIETTEVSDDNLLYDSSFDDLQSYIDDTPEGGEIELHNDYSIADGGNTLKITKNITINGNNHILNGAGENELSQSKQIIEQNIGQECVTIVYPNCVTGNKGQISKYYISGRTCSGQLVSSNPGDMFEISSMIVGSTTQNNNAQALNSIADSAAQQGKWAVYLIHGIDNDGGYSPISSSALDQHFSYVKQQNKWWVATFKDVSKYILEANNLVISETGSDSSYMIDVSCSHQTSITKLDVPVTISRKISCASPQVKQNGSAVQSAVTNGKVIFNVVPGNKYSIQCS